MRDVPTARLAAFFCLCLLLLGTVTICAIAATLVVDTPYIEADAKFPLQSEVSSQHIRYHERRQRQSTATPDRRTKWQNNYPESVFSKFFQTLFGVRTFLKRDKVLAPTPRIVNGTNVTDASQYPQYAFTYGQQLCGGTLIYPDVILSAAHCQGAWLDGLVLGGIRADGVDGGFYTVEQEYPHPDYNADTDENDIMLVKLEQPISDIPLQAVNFDPTIPRLGEEVTIIGIGYIQEGGPFAQFLQQVQVNIVGFEQCNEVFNRIVDDIMVCTYAEGKDACQGDSGGPLLTEQGIQVGIVSFGIGCARPDKPAVFTRTSAYERFIANGICTISSMPPDNCNGDAPITSSTLEPSVAASPGLLSFAPGAVPVSAAPSAIASNGGTSLPNTSTPATVPTLKPTTQQFPGAPNSSTSPNGTSGPSSRPPSGTQPSIAPFATPPTSSGTPDPIGPPIVQPPLKPSSNQYQFVPTARPALPGQQIYDPIFSQPSPNQILPTKLNIPSPPDPTSQEILDPILFQPSPFQLLPPSPAPAGEKIFDPILLVPSPFQVIPSPPANEIPPSLFLPSSTLSSSTIDTPIQIPIPKSVMHPTVLEQINPKPKRDIFFNRLRRKGQLVLGNRNDFNR